MARFVVTLHYTVAPAVPTRSHVDVLADLVGPRHRFSMLGPDTLAVSVRVRAAAASEAVQVLDARVRAAWPMVDGGTLTLATAIANGDLVRVGARNLLPGRETRVRTTLHSINRPGEHEGGEGWGGGWGDDRGDDWGDGTAGVREPRRPRTPPGHLSAAAAPPIG